MDRIDFGVPIKVKAKNSRFHSLDRTPERDDVFYEHKLVDGNVGVNERGGRRKYKRLPLSHPPLSDSALRTSPDEPLSIYRASTPLF